MYVYMYMYMYLRTCTYPSVKADPLQSLDRSVFKEFGAWLPWDLQNRARKAAAADKAVELGAAEAPTVTKPFVFSVPCCPVTLPHVSLDVHGGPCTWGFTSII